MPKTVVQIMSNFNSNSLVNICNFRWLHNHCANCYCMFFSFAHYLNWKVSPYSNFTIFFTWTGVPLGVSILRKAPFEVIPGHIIWAPDKINLIAPLSTIWIGNMNGNWWRTWRFGSHGPSLCLKNKASLFTTRSSIFSWHFTKRAGQSFFGQNSSKYSSNSGYSSII